MGRVTDLHRRGIAPPAYKTGAVAAEPTRQNGALDWERSSDLRFTKASLYQLSYEGEINPARRDLNPPSRPLYESHPRATFVRGLWKPRRLVWVDSIVRYATAERMETLSCALYHFRIVQAHRFSMVGPLSPSLRKMAVPLGV